MLKGNGKIVITNRTTIHNKKTGELLWEGSNHITDNGLVMLIRSFLNHTEYTRYGFYIGTAIADGDTEPSDSTSDRNDDGARTSLIDPSPIRISPINVVISASAEVPSFTMSCEVPSGTGNIHIREGGFFFYTGGTAGADELFNYVRFDHDNSAVPADLAVSLTFQLARG